jgi:hypothetical protein
MTAACSDAIRRLQAGPQGPPGPPGPALESVIDPARQGAGDADAPPVSTPESPDVREPLTFEDAWKAVKGWIANPEMPLFGIHQIAIVLLQAIAELEQAYENSMRLTLSYHSRLERAEGELRRSLERRDDLAQRLAAIERSYEQRDNGNAGSSPLAADPGARETSG